MRSHPDNREREPLEVYGEPSERELEELEENQLGDAAEMEGENDGPLDPVRIYMQQIGKYPILSQKEQLAIGWRISEHRDEALRSMTYQAGLEGLLENRRALHKRLKNKEIRSVANFVRLAPEQDINAEQVVERLPGHIKRIGTLVRSSRKQTEALLTGTANGHAAAAEADIAKKQAKAAELLRMLGTSPDDAEEMLHAMELALKQVTELEKSMNESDGGARRNVKQELTAFLVEIGETPATLAGKIEKLHVALSLYNQARNELAQSNLRLVASIAKRYKAGRLSYMDLVQEGNAGMLYATKKFEPRLGYQFTTYATWWIRQAISRALADEDTRPAYIITQCSAVYRAQRQIEQSTGEPCAFDEALETCDFTESEKENIRQWNKGTMNIHDEVEGSSEGNGMLGDMLSDDDAPDVVEQLWQKELHETVEELLKSLTKREREVIIERLGLRNGKPRTLTDVAGDYGITRERIRQIQARATTLLSRGPRGRRLKQFADDQSE